MHAHSPVPWKNLPSSSERAVQPVCCIHFSFTLKTQSGGQAGAAPPPFFSPMAFTLAAAHNDAQCDARTSASPSTRSPAGRQEPPRLHSFRRWPSPSPPRTTTRSVMHALQLHPPGRQEPPRLHSFRRWPSPSPPRTTTRRWRSLSRAPCFTSHGYPSSCASPSRKVLTRGIDTRASTRRSRSRRSWT